jgi:phage repressor protein C with HTH and peptisase S24 domain
MNFKENLIYLLEKHPDLTTISKVGHKINDWMSGESEPTMEELTILSNTTNISIDALLLKNLSETHANLSAYVSGENLRILATTVTPDNEENIELVPIKAKAGYACGYGDPDYLKVLPAFNLPFLSRDKKYRSFEIEGDSMPPLLEGDFVTGEFIRNWNYIKNGIPYILITKNEGIVFKIVINQISKNNTLKLYSTNRLYQPYEISISEVQEVWKFVNYISNEAPEINFEVVNQPFIKAV